MYYYLLIATKEKLNLDSSLDVLYINDNFTLIDDHHLKYGDQIFEFEYLIYSNNLIVTYQKPNLLLMENNIPITNYYYQTSIENIYYVTEQNLKNKILDIINNE